MSTVGEPLVCTADDYCDDSSDHLSVSYHPSQAHSRHLATTQKGRHVRQLNGPFSYSFIYTKTDA